MKPKSKRALWATKTQSASKPWTRSRTSVKARRVGNHVVADSGHALDQWRNGDVRQHQTFPALDEHAILDAEDGNLGDPVTHRVSTGTLDIDEGQPRWQPPAQVARQTPEQAHAFSATRLSD
ncbi:hypothetical protein MASR2M16_37520 [Thauera terpenica]